MIILDITKTSSNNCFIKRNIICFDEIMTNTFRGGPRGPWPPLLSGNFFFCKCVGRGSSSFVSGPIVYWGGFRGGRGYSLLRGLMLRGSIFENAQNVRGVEILRHRTGLLCITPIIIATVYDISGPPLSQN